MNIARVGLLVVAVGAAGAAGLLVRTLTSDKEAPAPVAAAEEPAAPSVLVAARDLEPGSLVSENDLRWQRWPADALSPSYSTDAGSPDVIRELDGAMVRMRLANGEPVTAAKLVKTGDAGYMAAMLEPGMRAISVKIEESTGAGGFILPGDHVDVILTREVENASGSGDAFDSETVLRNVRVLAIGQTFEDKGDERVVVGDTATLELTPRQSELLTLANALGDITLALRSAVADGVTAAIPEAGSLGGQSDTLNLVKYGRSSRVAAESSPGAAQ